MAVKFEQKQGGGLMGSPAVSAIMGYFTGGVAGAGAGLLKSKNPALGQAAGVLLSSKSSSPKADSGLAKPELGDSIYNKPAAPAPTSADEFTAPELGSSMRDSAMGRRQKLISQDNDFVHHQGLQALKDPSVPQYMRDAYAEPLLIAKHYRSNRGSV